MQGRRWADDQAAEIRQQTWKILCRDVLHACTFLVGQPNPLTAS